EVGTLSSELAPGRLKASRRDGHHTVPSRRAGLHTAPSRRAGLHTSLVQMLAAISRQMHAAAATATPAARRRFLRRGGWRGSDSAILEFVLIQQPNPLRFRFLLLDRSLPVS